MAGYLIFALALALRIGWVLLVPTRPVADFAMYQESAAHLVAFGELDPEYVYMPGYVFMLAGVRALGGGWLAAKLVGALMGALAAAAVFGMARRVWDGKAALAAGLATALWPVGIAVASVTGTDMPAAALLAGAGYFLLRFAPARPALASVLFGVLMGLAAYVRAVALPLCVLALFPLRAAGLPWRRALRYTVVAGAVTLLVLAPWIVRNRLRYGETFATDSHGGLTALVGTNPNTDGHYSRSLNLMLREVTGYRLLAEPHRDADRAAMRIAKQWAAFDVAYGVGLLAGKAERLLARERAALYWPLFRAGVLPAGQASWFAERRSLIEGVVDTYWILVVAAACVGAAVAVSRRRWLVLSFLPAAAALAAAYTLIFAEQRYRLPIALFLIVPAGVGASWLIDMVVGLVRRRPHPGAGREATAALILVVAVFGTADALSWAGQRLRWRNRWAVHVCRIDGGKQLCAWRGDRPHSGLRGVWDGVGIAIPAGAMTETLVHTTIAAPPGDYTLSARVELVPPGARGELTLAAGGASLALPLGHLDGAPVSLSVTLRHGGGPLRVQARLGVPPLAPQSPSNAARFRHPMNSQPGPATPRGRLWLSDVRLDRR